MQPNIRNNNGELSKTPGGSTSSGEVLHLRTQTAQESLGITNQNGLFKATILAGILFAVVFGVLTVVPYFISSQNAGGKNLTPPTPEKTEPEQTPNPTPAPDPSPKPPVTPSPKISGKEEMLIKGGETGTKTGTPKSKDPFKSGPDDDLPGLK
ncbi:MAG: hypothetical protein U0792_08595 [Gemmataceae bacterium]